MINGTIEHAASNAAAVTHRITALVDRLCGTVPSPDNTKGQLAAAPNGLMEEGMRLTASVSENMAHINDALDRLDRSLP